MGKLFDQLLYSSKNDDNILSLGSVNIRRIRIISALLIMFNIIELFHASVLDNSVINYSIIAGIVISSYYFLATFFSKNYEWSQKHISWFVLTFWILFTLILTPFFFVDVMVTKAAINAALYACAFAMVPVFSSKIIIALYPVSFVYMIFIYFLAGADFTMLTSVIAFSVGGFALALIAQASFCSLYERLKTQSETDSLTGLYNKATGQSKMLTLLPLCRREKKEVTLFFLDIDHFKNYNDTFGHLAGDTVLKTVAETIQSTLVRKSDILSRIGGEEFVVMLVGTSPTDAVRLARKLLLQVEKLNLPSGNGAARDYVTISVGVHTSDLSDSECDETALNNLINKADQMLYKAKASGRNCVATEHKTYGPEEE